MVGDLKEDDEDKKIAVKLIYTKNPSNPLI
jgi:hypothetical protein